MEYLKHLIVTIAVGCVSFMAYGDCPPEDWNMGGDCVPPNVATEKTPTKPPTPEAQMRVE